MWLAIVHDNELHIVPNNDLIEHTEDEDCVCGPDTERLSDGSRVITHSSLDERKLRT